MDPSLSDFLDGLSDSGDGNTTGTADQGYGYSNYPSGPSNSVAGATTPAGQINYGSASGFSMFSGWTTTQWLIAGAVVAAVIVIAIQ